MQIFWKGTARILGTGLSKYAPHMAMSWLKLNSKFHNSKMELIKKDPENEEKREKEKALGD